MLSRAEGRELIHLGLNTDSLPPPRPFSFRRMVAANRAPSRTWQPNTCATVGRGRGFKPGAGLASVNVAASAPILLNRTCHLRATISLTSSSLYVQPWEKEDIASASVTLSTASDVECIEDSSNMSSPQRYELKSRSWKRVGPTTHSILE